MRGVGSKWSAGGLNERPLKLLVATVLSRPFHVVPSLLLAGAATALFGVHLLPVAIVAQMTLSTLNDFTVSLLNEVAASAVRNRDTYLRMQSFGQWMRRCGNVLTGVSGPILFNAASWLPWSLFGGVVFMWALALWAVLYSHARRITDGGRRGPLAVFEPFPKVQPWHQYEAEYVVRMEREDGGSHLLEVDLESNVLWLRGEVAEMRLEISSLRERVNLTGIKEVP